MRITKENQNLMVIKDRSIFAFLVGIIFTLAGFLVILKPNFFTNQPPLWSGVVGILLGIFVVFVTKITTISLDKTTNKLLFVWKTLLNKNIKEYNLGQIREIELQTICSSSSRGGGYSYRLAFVLNNGEQIPLNPSGSSIVRAIGKQIVTEKGIGTRIANFLNIPFQERRPPTVSETLSAVQSAIQNAAEKEMKKQTSSSNCDRF